jgi:hemoglobin-like flavoprotein
MSFMFAQVPPVGDRPLSGSGARPRLQCTTPPVLRLRDTRQLQASRRTYQMATRTLTSDANVIRTRPMLESFNRREKAMDTNQIRLVQDSFKSVAPIAEKAAALFYARLFELDPQLRKLFRGDIEEQGRKLMTVIGMAVRGLDNMAALVPVVENLGRRHVTYGVMPEHFELVGAALLWTLKQGLGSAFTSEIETAWAETYNLLANAMKEAATAEV